MEKEFIIEFVPYELALKLKALGFDKPCLSWFSKEHNYKLIFGAPEYSKIFIKNGCLAAPTYSQAFRWFREKYGLEGLILPQSQGAVIDGEPIYFIAIISYENELMKELFNSTNQEDLLHYNPREEAELACLEKLIEIVEQKK